MPKKHDRKSLEGILKRRGADQTPNVSVSETEIRSCGVCGTPEPMPADRKAHLWGLVIVWEYIVDHAAVATYNQFLFDNEMIAFTGMPAKSKYLGTYMCCEGGPTRYRTMWAYDSLQDMFDIWANPPAAVASFALQLRQKWLLDPNRSENRWVPAALMYTKRKSKLHNPFAMMTFDLAERMAMAGSDAGGDGGDASRERRATRSRSKR